MRGVNKEEWLNNGKYYRHVGIYAYRADILQQITQLPPTPLEQTESLEQLRWLENGYKIQIGITHTPTIGIDTPEGLERAIEWYRRG
jgi:3-deoxy-manno-octulosonate cytidylyltransferase (CMP-KDO synthetase)